MSVLATAHTRQTDIRPPTTVANLDLPPTKANPDEQEGVTALMLEGFSYPLYKHLRTLGYDFYAASTARRASTVGAASSKTRPKPPRPRRRPRRRSRTAAGRSTQPPATRTTGRMTSRVRELSEDRKCVSVTVNCAYNNPKTKSCRAPVSKRGFQVDRQMHGVARCGGARTSVGLDCAES